MTEKGRRHLQLPTEGYWWSEKQQKQTIAAEPTVVGGPKRVNSPKTVLNGGAAVKG